MNNFMALAFEEAQKGVDLGEGGPFGAVIVKDGEVIARGHNEVIKDNDPTAHAEMVVIRKASAILEDFHLKGCTLYVTGEPCPMCFSAIHWAHMDTVVYCLTKEEAAEIGFDDVNITELLLHPKQEDIPFIHTPDKACQELYTAWFANPKSIRY